MPRICVLLKRLYRTNLARARLDWVQSSHLLGSLGDDRVWPLERRGGWGVKGVPALGSGYFKAFVGSFCFSLLLLLSLVVSFSTLWGFFLLFVSLDEIVHCIHP
jgi:hypothetical protein